MGTTADIAAGGSFIDEVEHAIKWTAITEVVGVAQIAFGLSSSNPETLKMGWPLGTSIEAAIDTLERRGITFEDRVATAREALRRFEGHPNDTDPLLIEGQRVYAWPGTRVEFHGEMPSLYSGGRPYPAAVNWSALGDMHPVRARQYARAILHAADLAEG